MNKFYKKTGLVVVMWGVSITSNSQIINTIAGDSTAGYTGDGGLATVAELNGPAGIAEDATGNIYVADQNNNSIRMVNTSGIISTIAGINSAGYSGDGGLATVAELNAPYGLAIDISGNIYIADWSNDRIRVINTSGIINTFAGNGYGASISSGGYSGDGGQASVAELYLPADVKLDNAGNIYIADEVNNRIRMVNTAGIITTVAGDSIQGFAGDGGQATVAELHFPVGIALDATGYLYIADQRNNRVRMVNTSGNISTFAGNGTPSFFGDGGPATAAELLFPYGILVDTAGNVYISDVGNSRIRTVNTSGIINTIAGINYVGYSGDGGPATAAEINNPLGIILDASNNLYIADAGNNRVRKITSNIATVIKSVTSNTNDVTIYPIPTTSSFTISGITKGQTIEVYNYLGQMVYTSTQAPPIGGGASFTCQINISSLPNGIYLARILNTNGSIVAEKKIVKTE
jgi:trimeric autotransporter adhesin